VKPFLNVGIDTKKLNAVGPMERSITLQAFCGGVTRAYNLIGREPLSHHTTKAWTAMSKVMKQWLFKEQIWTDWLSS
jgi:hypothetical protein